MNVAGRLVKEVFKFMLLKGLFGNPFSGSGKKDFRTGQSSEFSLQAAQAL
jgi:hypothetical protein